MSGAVPAETIARALSYGDELRLEKTGDFRCYCPVHEVGGRPHHPSLLVGAKGWLCESKKCKPELITEAMREMGVLPRKPEPVGDPFQYTDEEGHVLFEVQRFEPGFKPGEKKSFAQSHFSPEGRRVKGLGGKKAKTKCDCHPDKQVRIVPFHLSQLIAKVAAGKLVVIPEGERKVLACEANGIGATCNPMGAGKWNPAFNEFFRGATVAVLADNDQAGRDHAYDVARNLTGIAKEVKVVELPGLAEKGDVINWLAQRQEKSDVEIRVEFAALIKATPPFDPAEHPKPEPKKAKVEAPPKEKEEPQARVPIPEGKTGIPEEYSQSALADIFDQRHANELKHVEKWEFWLRWDGKRWVENADKIARDYAENIAREASQRATRDILVSKKEQRALAARGIASAIAGFAGDRRNFRSEPEDWDKDLHLLNVANGTLDLRTGELRPHSRADWITKITNIEYVRNAQAPRWYQFLSEVFSGDMELCEYIKRLVGYSLTGSQEEKLFVVCQGPQDSGKSVFREILLALGGDYSQSAPLSLFLEKKYVETNNPEVARLRGMRIVGASETGEGRKFDSEKIKSLTGRETVTACHKYASPFDFVPSDTKWLFTNYVPLVNWDDGGMWTRLKLIKFLVQFKVGDPLHPMDKKLPEKLRAEAEMSGILAWAAEGAMEWYRDGLQEPESVTKAVAEFRAEVDKIQPVLDEYFETHPEFRDPAFKDKYPGFNVTKTLAYAAYRDWMHVNGEDRFAYSAIKFGKELIKKGFAPKEKDTTGERIWRGLKLRPEVKARLDRSKDESSSDEIYGRQGRFN